MQNQAISDRWKISQNAEGFTGERRRPGVGDGLILLFGVTKDILLRRIEAWEREQVANGRGAE